MELGRDRISVSLCLFFPFRRRLSYGIIFAKGGTRRRRRKREIYSDGGGRGKRKGGEALAHSRKWNERRKRRRGA